MSTIVPSLKQALEKAAEYLTVIDPELPVSAKELGKDVCRTAVFRGERIVEMNCTHYRVYFNRLGKVQLDEFDTLTPQEEEALS